MLRKIQLLAVILVTPLVSLETVSAQTASANALTQVEYAGATDRIEFRFDATEALEPQDITARLDKGVLVLRFEGVQTDRRWIKTHDSSIKRVLLHQSHKDGFAAHLRIRMSAKVASALIENIRVRSENGNLIVAIPRNLEVASQWAAAEDIKATPAKGNAVNNLTKKDSQSEDGQNGIETRSLAAEDPEDTPLELGAEASLDEKNEAWESAAPETGSAAPGDGPSAGALGVSVMLLCFVGVVLWKRARPRRPGAVGGPMIKTISTHMLGPKQGLLLVDVAGEMVLLSTGDKGVQMLTRIEGQNDHSEASDRLRNMLEVGDRAIPAEAINEVRSRSLGSQFGRVLDRIRNVSDSRTQDEPEQFNYAVSEPDGVADAEKMTVGDMYRQAQARGITTEHERFDRRDFRAVMPKRAPRLDEVEPPLATGDNLLNKLRDLKSA